jgi:hypothetical protein
MEEWQYGFTIPDLRITRNLILLIFPWTHQDLVKFVWFFYSTLSDCWNQMCVCVRARIVQVRSSYNIIVQESARKRLLEGAYLRVPFKAWDFLTIWGSISFIERTFHHLISLHFDFSNHYHFLLWESNFFYIKVGTMLSDEWLFNDLKEYSSLKNLEPIYILNSLN